ncbi:MAG: GntR family transcriptional regulator [Candidatus Merdivicinus sp.]|jgi:DNA-binding GntR family transcriptional regulator
METTSLSQRIYHTLLNKILSNEFPSGTILNRRTIAAEYHVSVAPVLEAMLQLEKDGLLETIPRKGTRVTVIRREQVSGNLLIREALETTAIRIICSRETRATFLETLRPIAEKIDLLTNSNHSFFSMDQEFHCALVALVGSNTLSQEYERISRLTFFYNISTFVPFVQSAIQQSHVELLDQLIHADPDKAQKILHEHIISGKQNLILTV